MAQANIQSALRAPLFLLVTLAIGVALIAVACGGDGDDDQPQQTTTTPAERAGRDDDTQDQSAQDEREEPEDRTNQVAANQTETPVISSSRPNGVLRIARSEPINLDPAQITDVDSAVIAVEIFGGLLTLDRELRIAPDLAVSVPAPNVNADGTATYRFTLRDNATFHDGKRITAEDVKWSIERHADPETLSPTAPDFLADIFGAPEYIRGRADEILGLQVID